MRVIEVKYACEGGGWCSNSVTGPHGVSLWKTIRCGWPNFSHYIQFEVRDGPGVKFWHDLWCRESPLKIYFLELFRISRNKKAYVATVMNFSKGPIQSCFLCLDCNFGENSNGG